MLTHIQIRDFVIIDALELELGAGLTVLTGETGAGKSILVDALLLASGGRAGAEVVRHGAERAEVTATFGIKGNDAAQAWFKEQEIDCEDECVLRRIVTSDGRSRAYVNGQSLAIQALRQLAETLVDIHGQMEYQSLMKRSAQRELLDQHGAHESLTTAVRDTWRELKALRDAQSQALAASQDRAAKLELLNYHVAELTGLDLKPTEVVDLTSERQRVAQSGRLAQGIHEVLQAVRDAEDGAADHALTRALTVTRQLATIDTRLNEVAQSLDESLIALREAADAATRYEADLEVDPIRQEWLEQRLAAIENVARKHRVETAMLPALLQNLTAELTHLQDLTVTLKGMEAEVHKASQRYLAAAEQLSNARGKTATSLAERVTALMQGLGMPGGKFSVALTAKSPDQGTEHGLDDVEFMVSANPGQPPQPLAKTASGGELSRISLSVQVAAVESLRQPCLVFDEVDAGIGGGVAEIVGRQLRALGSAALGSATLGNATRRGMNRGGAQVLCVTHLPQVASQAHAHVRVTKLTDGKTTRTSLHPLTDDERIEEIARMLGGVEITGKAREHAVEMLKSSAGEERKKAKKK
ncbi:MAG TPA: DNA repair protein RecN [Steroidobacteraceae bacterium]|nr:DNA repair protein RecN [Steroidobacteraceae bacterium]